VVDDPSALALYGAISPEAFTVPQYRAVFEAVRAAGGPAAGTADWVGDVSREAGEALAGVVSQLAVTPLPTDRADGDYARSVLSRMLDLDLTRQIAELRGAMQRAGEGSDEAAAAFVGLIALEKRRRALREE
jgi:DNA primase